MQAIDLFSGAGGMSIGAIAAGIDVRYAVELNPHAAATYRLNHNNTALFNRDIRSISMTDFKDLDRKKPTLVFGGPPCQGFSTSNQKNRDFKNENNWLFLEYLRIVESVKPEWVVFENVKGLLETEDGYFLDAVLNGFKNLGYSTNHFVLNSADFGVPQRRNRLFIIGSLSGTEFPAPMPTVEKYVSVSDAIGDLAELNNGDTRDHEYYPSIAQSEYAKTMRGELEGCWNNLVTKNADHILERYRHIPQGGNWESIPDALMKNYADSSRCHSGIYRRLNAKEPAAVIGNFRKNMLIHPFADRGLSVREAARLQSIPDKFRFLGSIGFQQQQVGNLVPPLLAKVIFNRLIAF